MFLDDLVSHGTLPDIKCTLPDYLHRPIIFRWGELSRFFVWVPWEVFHTVLCLIMYIVGTSFEGESYRLFFLGSLGSLNDSRPAGDKTSPPGFEPATVGI